MKNLAQTVTFLGALGVLVGCGDRTVADEPAPSPTPPNVGAPADSEGESEGEVVCRGRDGLIVCEDECVDPMSNNEHCGACDHECKEPWFFGDCVQGECPSALWCGGAWQGLINCEDVCALHEQVCDEDPPTSSGGCGGGYTLYFEDGLHRCEEGLGGQYGVQASCTTPIDWSIKGGWEHISAQAVACCCTQDLPS